MGATASCHAAKIVASRAQMPPHDPWKWVCCRDEEGFQFWHNFDTGEDTNEPKECMYIEIDGAIVERHAMYHTTQDVPEPAVPDSPVLQRYQALPPIAEGTPVAEPVTHPVAQPL